MKVSKKFNLNIRINFILVLIFIYTLSNGQNLVPNSSFEVYTGCPAALDFNKNAIPPWYCPSFRSAAYGNACITNSCCGVPLNLFGHSYQLAKSGNAYATMEFITNYGQNQRDYIQTKLLDSLNKGRCYYIEFNVSLVTGAQYPVNNIALHVSDTSIWSINGRAISVNPQIISFGNPIINDSINWIKVGGVYVAKGGEKYITIGNFKDDAHTDTLKYLGFQGGDYYVDDVSVIPLDSMQLKADAGRDTTIVKGDSVWIGSRLCGLTNVVWYDASNNVIDTGAPGLWVKPTNNTFYVIEQDVCGQYSRDTVFVNVQPLPVSMLNFECLMLNERQVKVSWQTATEINVSHFNVQRSTDGVNFNSIGKVKAKGAGTYTSNDSLTTHDSRFTTLYYRLEIVDRNGAISYSEVRELSIINYPFFIYPNPTKGDINIELPILGNWQITVTDMEGRIVWQEECRGCNGTIKHNLSGSKSLYFIKIINKLSGQQSINKIILQ